VLLLPELTWRVSKAAPASIYGTRADLIRMIAERINTTASGDGHRA
jgi:hypothetical protein